jgi:solute carrier family 35 protein F5
MTDLTRRRYFGGIAALLGVVFIWVTSSFAMNVKVVQLSPFLFTDTHTLLIGSLLE